MLDAARALRATNSRRWICGRSVRDARTSTRSSRAFVGDRGSADAHARRGLADARASDARREEGARSEGSGGTAPAVDGVPSAKDNLCASVGTTTAGSAVLRGYRSPVEASAIARLRERGCCSGKRTWTKFAWKSHAKARKSLGDDDEPISWKGARSSGVEGGPPRASRMGARFTRSEAIPVDRCVYRRRIAGRWD